MLSGTGVNASRVCRLKIVWPSNPLRYTSVRQDRAGASELALHQAVALVEACVSARVWGEMAQKAAGWPGSGYTAESRQEADPLARGMSHTSAFLRIVGNLDCSVLAARCGSIVSVDESKARRAMLPDPPKERAGQESPLEAQALVRVQPQAISWRGRHGIFICGGGR